jgi:hypothetical protein
MSQTDAKIKTNTIKVVDCLELILKSITIANGYITDGIVVDRSRDPRVLWQNKDSEYRKTGTMVRIKMGDWKKLRNKQGAVGQTRRKLQTIEFICSQTLTKTQDPEQIKIDMIQDWLRHDIEDAIYSDLTLMEAATALNVIDGTWGTVPSYINASIDQGLTGSVAYFPDCYQTFVLTYEYEESGDTGIPGRL